MASDPRGLRPRTVRLHRSADRPPPELDPSFAGAGARPRRGPMPEEDDDEDAIETVLESQWGGRAPLADLMTEERWDVPVESEGDAPTQRRDHMPISFIGEAVMDDQTEEDPASAAVRWRDEALYNITPTLPRRDPPRTRQRSVPRVQPAGAARQIAAPPTPPRTTRTHAPPPRPVDVRPAPARPPPGVPSEAGSPPSLLPPPPPPGLRTLTPPTGRAHADGLPEMAWLDGSISPPPAYRAWVAPAWAPPPPEAAPARPTSSPPRRRLRLTDRDPAPKMPNASSVVTVLALGVLVATVWVALGLLW